MISTRTRIRMISPTIPMPEGEKRQRSHAATVPHSGDRPNAIYQAPVVHPVGPKSVDWDGCISDGSGSGDVTPSCTCPRICAVAMRPSRSQSQNPEKCEAVRSSAAGSVTNSPMSTNPPIAVTTPKATAASLRTSVLYPRPSTTKRLNRTGLRVSPRHDRPDPWPRLARLAGVVIMVIMVLAAFGVFFVGLAATNARGGD